MEQGCPLKKVLLGQLQMGEVWCIDHKKGEVQRQEVLRAMKMGLREARRGLGCKEVFEHPMPSRAQ